MNPFRKHVVKNLSAYCYGELSAEGKEAVAEHLPHCVYCEKVYRQVRLGVGLAGLLKPVPAPDSLWKGIEAALDATPQPLQHFSNSWRRRSRTLAALAWASLALTVISFIGSQYNSRGHISADLDPYLQRLQHSASGEIPEAISSPPPGFSLASDRIDTKDQQWNGSPLAGYSLSIWRTYKARNLAVHQLVYSRGSEIFTVFVAPNSIKFNLGDREIQKATISGITCHRIACPQTSLILFGNRRYRCLLVSRSHDTNELAAIMNYFVTDHDS